MLVSGSVVGGRFQVIRNFAPAASSIAVARDAAGARYWLVQFAATRGEAELGLALERQQRFAVGIPALARPTALGVEAGEAFLAFAAPRGGSLAEAHTAPWPAARVAALGVRIAAALGPLHDQGIAYGCLTPELVAEGEPHEVLYGFGVAALATAFGAAGEASQLVAPEYRAPELRAALLPPSPASDLFALGVLLRALLAAASSLTEDRSQPPVALEALLAQATAADPRLRPNDVRAFAAAFAECAHALAVAPAAPAVPDDAPAAAGPSGAEPAPPPTPVAAHEWRALPPAPAPIFAPAPPFAARPSSKRTAFIALAIVGFGFVLMLGGIAGALVYAARHAPAARAASSAAVTSLPPAPAAPAPAVPTSAPPAPSEDDEDPAARASPDPALTPRPKLRQRRHAPLVAPGVGPSSFPGEARVALPVLGSEPIWGTRSAPLTWVMFGDLDCPYTRRAWRALEAVKASFGDDLRIVFRHRPLREHPNALRAARVLSGLGRQKGSQAFFDVLHRVAQGEESLTDEHLQAELSAAGFGALDPAELAAAGESSVLADLQLAGQFAVRSTPFSYLNGLPVDGERSASEIETMLRDEQRSVTWVVAGGVPAGALYAARTSSNLLGVGDANEPRFCAPIDRSPTVGPADALVTLVEFSDFECPFCRRVEPTLKTLLSRYPKALRLVWKDFPLPQHSRARLLANFAADAQRRGSNVGFWAVHDGIFAEPSELDDQRLESLAGKAGLDGTLLMTSARAGVHDARIGADIRLGESLGVSGTPTFFVNGRRLQGALSLEQFESVIASELKTAQRIVSGGVPPRDVYGLVCD